MAKNGTKPGREEGDIKFDRKRRDLFLDHFAKTNLFNRSAEVAGVHPTTVARYLKPDSKFYDEEFAAEKEKAENDYLEVLKEEAHRRAVEGVEKPVVGGKDKDEVIIFVREYDTRLLEMLMKRADPGFKDRVQVDQNTHHSGHVSHSHQFDFSKLSKEGREKLRSVLEEASGEDES